jgi:predicted RNA-binding protein YlxR (DUF448 family)
VTAEAPRTHAVVDPLARMPGRGAYLCRAGEDAQPQQSCLTLAEHRGAIARALRRSLPDGLVLDDSKLVESVSR